jgi:hypothetical protein
MTQLCQRGSKGAKGDRTTRHEPAKPATKGHDKGEKIIIAATLFPRPMRERVKMRRGGIGK